jgi:hypothetical protein
MNRKKEKVTQRTFCMGKRKRKGNMKNKKNTKERKKT